MKPQYRLQVEFDFDANEDDLDELQKWMDNYFGGLIKTWNKHTGLMQNSGGLNVEIVEN